MKIEDRGWRIEDGGSKRQLFAILDLLSSIVVQGRLAAAEEKGLADERPPTRVEGTVRSFTA